MTALTEHPERACRDANPDGFTLRDEEKFPTAEPRLRAAALNYCLNCPLRPVCKREGRNEWGLWGGVMYRRGFTPLDLLDPESTPQHARRHQRLREAS